MRAAVCILLSLLFAGPAFSAPARKPLQSSRPAAASPYRRSPCVGALVMAEKKGRWTELSADHADDKAYPASVTKLMTLLLVLEDIQGGRYAATNEVVATEAVYLSEPSWIGLKVGERMSVFDLCMALMVESANDAALALGVHSAGSLEAFVARMNARAAELGMSRTRYYNPNGLPPSAAPRRRYPWKSFNETTARDQMKLALALVAHPLVFQLTSVKTCDLVKTASGYRVAVTRRVGEPNRTTVLAPGEKLVKQLRNHNNLMVKDRLKVFNPDGSEAIDGLKTGYIDAGGSSIVLTGRRGGKRAIVVVLGSSSADERDATAGRLLTDALGTISW